MKKTDLFNQLIKKLDKLVLIWDNFHKGEALSHFDGIFTITYIESDILKESLTLIKTLYSDDPHGDISSEINRLKIDFIDIYDIYSEYLMGYPILIEGIADIVSDFFLKYNIKVAEFDKIHLIKTIELADNLLNTDIKEYE